MIRAQPPMLGRMASCAPTLSGGLDPAVEQGADDALVHEVLADLQKALGDALRHARGGAGPAGRTVDRFVAVEDGVPGMRFWMLRLVGPHDVAHSRDMLVFRMDGLNRLLHRAAHYRTPLEDLVGAHGVEPGPGLLRLDDGVVVAPVSHVDNQFAKAGNRDGDLDSMEIARDVEQPHLVDMAAIAFVDDLDAARRDFERQPPLDLGRH